jgi:hypothetical protein
MDDRECRQPSTSAAPGIRVQALVAVLHACVKHSAQRTGMVDDEDQGP